MNKERIIIVGAGPCGLAAAIRCKEAGLDPLIIEKENIVSAIYHYPTHQTFFSAANKLEIGDVPFYSTNHKPKRNEALVYYREVVQRMGLRIQTYEEVERIQKQENGQFRVHTVDRSKAFKEYEAAYIIVATGYYNNPNRLGIKGEEMSHVFHYFKEAHPFYGQRVLVIGGRNSAVDTAMELQKAGANVTVVYRGNDYSTSIKPWILPEFRGLVNKEEIDLYFETEVVEIHDTHVNVLTNGVKKTINADFVFAMTGYHPDHSFLTSSGVAIESDTGRPVYNKETFETNVDNLFIAGVIAAGNHANEIFIESGRFHGLHIVDSIIEREKRGR
ncbi:YpdA family putative bacillithiol disulfide reductase [Geomicrobium sp. JCM 19038]|uniref:YpdA family putative bacillithiol disulfide reductase n=1 Tax=Geomicrobium sp. JCM 19038 TaxID=1460635 RepID=UPI00045F39C6|nr:YpdA family putative bacillithiol disulfide reductase [Geomicrobium sp. JCM 19038]GAK06623.1 thioredoxin reductase [Geomicrobium sp. JCM 19038]